MIGHLNVNYIRKKFDLLKKVVAEEIDILMITETKLDDSFPLLSFRYKVFVHHLD